MFRNADLTGQRFGRLTAVRRGEDHVRASTGRRSVRWVCQCDCGATTLVQARYLRSGGTSSCGCLDRERRKYRREYVGYLGAHMRVFRDRGKASAHPCVDCGAPAAHWSYDNSDPWR